jgi:hypothetical protein
MMLARADRLKAELPDACVPQLAAHLAFAFDSNVDSNLATRS